MTLCVRNEGNNLFNSDCRPTIRFVWLRLARASSRPNQVFWRFPRRPDRGGPPTAILPFASVFNPSPLDHNLRTGSRGRSYLLGSFTSFASSISWEPRRWLFPVFYFNGGPVFSSPSSIRIRRATDLSRSQHNPRQIGGEDWQHRCNGC